MNHLKSGQFENWTKIDHSKSGHVRDFTVSNFALNGN